MIPPIWPDAPRYGSDEPFPPYQYTGAPQPHPTRDPRGHSFGAEGEGDLNRGIDLYHAGYLWEAHEEWEGLWKGETDPGRRDVLQGLIQMAAALLKAHVGEARGARRLARRARSRLAGTALLEPFDRCFGGLLRGQGLAALRWEDAPRLRPENL